MKQNKGLLNKANNCMRKISIFVILCIILQIIIPIITNLEINSVNYAYRRDALGTGDPYESVDDFINYTNLKYDIIENPKENIRYYIEKNRIFNREGYSKKIATAEIMDYSITTVSIPDKIRHADTYWTIDSLKNDYKDLWKPYITSLTIPNTLLKRYNQYLSKENIKYLHVIGVDDGNGGDVISADTFRGYKNLYEVQLENINVIGDYAFAQLENLERVIIYDDKPVEIGNAAFFNCKSLSFFQFVNTTKGSPYLKSVGDYAFASCTKLDKFYSFNENAFENDYLSYIGISAFEDCENFSNQIIISKNAPIRDIGERAFYNTKITRVSINNSNIKTIKQYTFANCNSLGSVDLPSSLTKIENHAFYSTKTPDLNEAYNIWNIPSNVTTIGGYAFYGCNNNIKFNDLSNVSLGQNGLKNVGKISANKWPSGVNETKLKNGNAYQQKTTEKSATNSSSKNNSQNKATINNGKNNIKSESSNTSKKVADTQAPKISSSISSDKKIATLKWSATDNVGITGYKIVQNANAAGSSGYTNVNSTKELSGMTTTFNQNGIWYLYVKDAQGNSSCIKITVGDIDTTAPTIENIRFSNTSDEVRYVTMSWVGKDSGTGIVGYKISDKQNDWGTDGYKSYNGKFSYYEDSYTFFNNGTYYLYLKDDAGYEICQGIVIGNIDKTFPYIDSVKLSTTKPTKKVKVTWNAGDTGVGIIEWKISKSADAWEGNYTTRYEKAYKYKSDSITIKENGTYYLFIRDNKGNAIRRTITISNIDTESPKFTQEPTVKLFGGSYAEISYKATDNNAGIQKWKLEGYSGAKYYYDSNGKELIAKNTNLQKIKVTKNGTYKLTLTDAAGNVETSKEIKVTGIDSINPKISSLKVTSNSGITINGINYIKKDSELTFRVVFSEAVEIDKDEISIKGMTITNETISIKKISDTTYDITLTGNTASLGSTDGNVQITLEKDFAKDSAGNTLKASRTIGKIILDNTAPKVEANYKTINSNEDDVSAKITDQSKIAKMQWRVYEIDNQDGEPIWQSSMKGADTPLNKSTISEENNILKLKTYKGKVVKLYVEDILGNSGIFAVNPPIKASYDFVKRSGNEVTYRITMNLKAKLDTTLANVNNLKQMQEGVAENYTFKSLIRDPSDTTERKFLLTVVTDGTENPATILIPQGTIYVYDRNDSREKEIKIKMDNKAPTIANVSVPTKKMQKVELSVHVSDTDSGIVKYNYQYINNGEVLTNKTKKANGKNIDVKMILVCNRTIKLTVWDKHGNSATKEIVVNNVDTKAPQVTNIEYSAQNENGKVDITIYSNEDINAENWENIDSKTIKRTYDEENLRGENVKATDVKIKDEAENVTTVKLEDKIAPRVTNILVTNIDGSNKKVDIKFSESIKQTEDLITSGWGFSEDMQTLSKITNSNEEIYVQDMLGNQIEEPIKIKIKEDEETEKLVTKIQPKDKYNPVTEHYKTLFLSRKVKFVNLLNLADIAEYSILDEGMRIRIKFTKNFSNPEQIQLIEENGSVTNVTISPVSNIVIKGDSNNDGEVNNDDLDLLMNSYNVQVEDRFKFFAMDINDDGVINSEDYALWMKKYN